MSAHNTTDSERPKAHWSFRSSSRDFDGRRILREAREQGAEIVVIERDGQWVILIHESLREMGFRLRIGCPAEHTRVGITLGSPEGELRTIYRSDSEWYERPNYEDTDDLQELVAKTLAYQRKVHAAHAKRVRTTIRCF